MAFTLEDGTGVAGANALVDDATVTAYLADRGRETENDWNILSVAQKQQFIVQATDYLEKVYGRRFKGRRTNETQGLSWPRRDVADRDGFVIAENVIPSRLQEAAAEYAVRAASLALLPDPVVDDTGRTVVGKREKVGPIEEETRYEEGGALSRVLRPYPAADRLVSEFITSSGGLVRG